jgi:hypothetical protein
MKKIINILILIFSLQLSYGQTIVDIAIIDGQEPTGRYYKDINGYFDKFLGIWEYQDGNQIFRVHLWKEVMVEYNDYWKDRINGHFQKISISASGEETIIYTSEKTVAGGTDIWSSVISLGSIKGASHNKATGLIFDNCQDSYSAEQPLGLQANLEISITSGTGAVGTEMFWHPYLFRDGFRFSHIDYVFKIPTDITLTKVSL